MIHCVFIQEPNLKVLGLKGYKVGCHNEVRNYEMSKRTTGDFVGVTKSWKALPQPEVVANVGA